MDADDGRWTSLALGEPATQEDVDALGRDAAAREELARTRAMARLLTVMYREERRLRRRVRPWLLAAAAAIGAVVALWAWRLDQRSAAATQAVARRAVPSVRVVAPTVPAAPTGERRGEQIVITTECE